MNYYNKIGGYHPVKQFQSWPAGSIFENEGQMLYDLVIKHKPEKIIEVGAFHGCSTAWITAALAKNGKGKLISYDIDPGAWSLFKERYPELMPWVELRNEDALKIKDSCDMLFEDGLHHSQFTRKILKNIKAPVVVCHDYMHWSVYGENVREDSNAVLGPPTKVFFTPPSDCGLGIWEIKDFKYEKSTSIHRNKKRGRPKKSG